jgi:hypothetical protein
MVRQAHHDAVPEPVEGWFVPATRFGSPSAEPVEGWSLSFVEGWSVPLIEPADDTWMHFFVRFFTDDEVGVPVIFDEATGA